MNNKTAPVAITDERAAFEKWAKSIWRHPEDFDPAIGAKHLYNSYAVQSAWFAWQARAALSCASQADIQPEELSCDDVERLRDALSWMGCTTPEGLENCSARQGSLIRDLIRAVLSHKKSMQENAAPVSQAMNNKEAEQPVAIRYLYVEDFAVTPKNIIQARNDGDLSPEEAVEWIEKLIRHNAALPQQEKEAALPAPMPVASDGWHDGAPAHPYDKEWFIAETTHGERVVLVALPEDYSYDFKTADETYYMAHRVKRWMQFPDSAYIPAPQEQPKPDVLTDAERLVIRLTTEGALDEIVGTGPYHLEQMDDGHWWMHFEDAAGEYADVNLSAKGKIRVAFEHSCLATDDAAMSVQSKEAVK